MVKNYRIWSVFFCLFSIFISAQTPDVVRIEYIGMPMNKSDVQISRVRLVTNIPIKVREKDKIIIGAEYNGINYNIQREVSFDSDVFKNFHVIDFNMAYMHQYNEDWRIIGVITPRISSTLNDGIQNGDIFLNITVGAYKDQQNIDKPTRLVLGIAYNASVALRIPLPVIYYEKRFNPRWTYVIGAPKSGMKYHYNEKSLIQAEFILDGYYNNLQNNIMLPSGASATAISSSAALVTLGYQYALGKNMFLYGYLGHALFREEVLRDDNRKITNTLNEDLGFFIRTGFRIGL